MIAKKKAKKFIFVTGGVLSSLGKGLASAAIGSLLEARGLSITIQKLDPYINIDPGTMNPRQHGEVYVTNDGVETDLDLGHYERFTNATLNKNSNFTTGKIYQSVINKEREGRYLGKTVQVVPHITDEIKRSIMLVADGVDIVIVEIGGTIGDIESLPFLEAIRQLKTNLGKDNSVYIHLTLVPYIETAKELKTKPTQHSVKELRSIGIQPDIILCRTPNILSPKLKEKIALFCDVSPDAVITAKDVKCIYEVPLIYHSEGLDNKIVELLKIDNGEPKLDKWEKFIKEVNKKDKPKIKIAVVGKYINASEAYKSINESLWHASISNNVELENCFINSANLNEGNYKSILREYNGILVPGGFGDKEDQGIIGKILAAKYARQNNIPYFGICLGLQTAVIEFARNVLKMKDANSTEFDKNTPNPIIYLMSKWFNERTNKIEIRTSDSEKGGTMRLGEYSCVIKKDSLAYKVYNKDLIYERHRHRYELNIEYKPALQKNGLIISGSSPNGELPEIIELKNHKWFLACQFHPEFKSRPMNPHPIFKAFVKASIKC